MLVLSLLTLAQLRMSMNPHASRFVWIEWHQQNICRVSGSLTPTVCHYGLCSASNSHRHFVENYVSYCCWGCTWRAWDTRLITTGAAAADMENDMRCLAILTIWKIWSVDGNNSFTFWWTGFFICWTSSSRCSSIQFWSIILDWLLEALMKHRCILTKMHAQFHP